MSVYWLVYEGVDLKAWTNHSKEHAVQYGKGSGSHYTIKQVSESGMIKAICDNEERLIREWKNKNK
jgi:hypothetical protein